MSSQVKLPPRVTEFMNDVVLKVNPDFKIRNKAHPDKVYWLASKIVSLFNKDMDTSYITVINGQCWFPASFFDADGNMTGDTYSEWNVIRVLSHEAIHEYDRKRLGTLPFTVLYLLPQLLAALSLLSILAIWNTAWLLCLFFLLFLVPIPALGRAWIEARAYKVNVSLSKMNGWDPVQVASHIYNKNFGSPAYYFMMPIKRWVLDRLLDVSHESEEPYKMILQWHKERNLL